MAGENAQTLIENWLDPATSSLTSALQRPRVEGIRITDSQRIVAETLGTRWFEVAYYSLVRISDHDPIEHI